MAEHTPTPWEVCNGTDIFPVDDPEARRYIANCDPEDAPVENDGDHPYTDMNFAEAKANTAFIVRAVNAHDDLVKALKEIKGRDSYIDATPRGERKVILGDLAKIADAALAKATGES